MCMCVCVCVHASIHTSSSESVDRVLGRLMKNLNTFVQLPVWVCQSCRRTTDGGMNRKMDLVSLVRSNDNSNIIVTWSRVSIAQYLILSG